MFSNTYYEISTEGNWHLQIFRTLLHSLKTLLVVALEHHVGKYKENSYVAISIDGVKEKLVSPFFPPGSVQHTYIKGIHLYSQFPHNLLTM